MGSHVEGAPKRSESLICAAPTCDDGQPNAAAALRDCVRSSRHGVLVVSGCSLGAVEPSNGATGNTPHLPQPPGRVAGG